MVSVAPNIEPVVRPIQHRDLEILQQFLPSSCAPCYGCSFTGKAQRLQPLHQWYGFLMLLRIFPPPLSHLLHTYVLEEANDVAGVIQVSPFNQTRSTWRIDQLTVAPASGQLDGGTRLLRHCLETIWEARMWLAEIDIDQNALLALYRHNGFQPLAHITYWSLAPNQLQQLAQREPALPNLLPVSNADATLLYQLDTAAMPPLVRQVFDRHIQDFKSNSLKKLATHLQQWQEPTEQFRAYVFEPQRKAAIGHFELCLCRDDSRPHVARLTVHPAYTWLYPELLTHMARLTQARPGSVLHLTSADYQPEREAYLQQIGAERMDQTLMMSRSVWHKLRESKSRSLETLPLSEVLQGLQPNQTPIPGRISSWGMVTDAPAALHSAAQAPQVLPEQHPPFSNSPQGIGLFRYPQQSP